MRRQYPVRCYECSSHDIGAACSDPFNDSEADLHPDIEQKMCDGPCAKWVQRPKKGERHLSRVTLQVLSYVTVFVWIFLGKVEVVRTCSQNLRVNMQMSLVCMQESRPGDGELCFCSDDLCNTATSINRPSHSPLLLALIASLLTVLLPLAQFTSVFCNTTEQICSNYRSNAEASLSNQNLRLSEDNDSADRPWTKKFNEQGERL